MMPFGDFLAHAEALFRKEAPSSSYSFLKSHIFNLGEDVKIEEALEEIFDDLKSEMKDGVKLPFQDISCASIVPAERSSLGRAGWVLDRLIELPISGDERKGLADVILPQNVTNAQREAAKRGPIQKLGIVRVEEGADTLISWICYFYGVIEGALVLTATPTLDMERKLGPSVNDITLTKFFLSESQPVLKQAAAISHPSNYVLQVRPKLTPREGRRLSSGHRMPVQKSPHYVVVDHEVLVSMSGRNGAAGTHASPVPHHRRGHWMRLAERCRAARETGKERVWVRPSYVGEREFADLKNDYKVLLDFGVKKETVLV